mmetsp:Transcript_97265/g.156867  ORF Transcript_97265/g.156867 Transcript_97265/m.156867 type:complete len:568 (-) Transcript_97265:1018-2721(-)|eukprot:CAMPEP_0179479574 /NCGR_PEP_ID=MMETSP0799-20121207/57790_1 /TAXON_ID=46947 /ORGANISM="Geminigera cryophila, Strain CCMP2564" /LENGTH=567 /DNA_ID=CAMNT_0021291293 /DNA_START=95 /DNA_END=1798 /DNA_ORIENTATION=+
MQIFMRTTVGRTVVLDAEPNLLVSDVKARLQDHDNIPADDQFLMWGGRVLDDGSCLSDCSIQSGATLSSHLRLRGGAAQRAKMAAAMAKAKQEREEEYNTWHHLADCTEDTGVMRVLCVSMILEGDRKPIQQTGADMSPFWGEGPDANDYDVTYDVNGVEKTCTGFPKQKDFDEAFATLMKQFVSEHWECMKVEKDKGNEGKRIYMHKGLLAEEESTFEEGLVEIVCGAGNDGLWFQGPKKIVRCDNGETVWDLVETAKKAGLWCDEYNCFRDPWKISGQYSDIERWMYGGIGTTTWSLNSKGKMTLWSQEDTAGALGLTDREKMRLRQMMQLSAKEALGKTLSVDEIELKKLVENLVEEAPCHQDNFGLYSWRIRPLKKILENKVVFWTNSEETLPKGSVADKSTSEKPSGGISDIGAGNEIIEFWKYEKKIGALRKKYILEDRQRLLDAIERFTPTYKAVIKNRGAEATDDGGDHYMTNEFQRKITNVVALALDMNMPDCEEDKIACFIKTLVEKRIGPTWHVLVGRSFGFSVQCEARHFLHLYMQHLAVVIWKSEPDPNAGKKS